MILSSLNIIRSLVEKLALTLSRKSSSIGAFAWIAGLSPSAGICSSAACSMSRPSIPEVWSRVWSPYLVSPTNGCLAQRACTLIWWVRPVLGEALTTDISSLASSNEKVGHRVLTLAIHASDAFFSSDRTRQQRLIYLDHLP